MRRCLILVAALALTAACSGGQAATTSVTTSTSSTTTSTTTTSTTTSSTLPVTTTVAPLPEGTWHRVPDDYEIFGGNGYQVMYSLLDFNGRLVAVGEDDYHWGSRAAVWFSADGITWDRVPNDEELFSGYSYQRMYSAAIWDGRLFAVGLDSSGGDADAAIWTSADGITWERGPRDPDVFGGEGDQAMWSITPWDGGLVAAGYDTSGGDCDAAIWTSADGVIWEWVPHEENVFGGLLHQRILSIIAWNNGLVAVGADQIGGDEDAVVWISTDGITWEWAPHDEEVFGGDEDQIMTSVVAWNGGLVAAGYDTSGGDQDAVIWVSSDGITWERIPHDEAVFGGAGDQAVNTVTVWDGGLAAGGYASSGEDRDAAVWTSSDAITWERAPDDEAAFSGDGDQEINSVIEWNGSLVAVGRDRIGGQGSAIVWYWTPD
jgi:hypothetical protein